MRWTSLNDLRKQFLDFFDSKGHKILQSFPLTPENDDSLLLINSGMAPMKKYFTGELKPPKKRVATCQKCIRTPDIERVGITARHGTFFEMLGNFSFGDYFKKEAIAWAWEFCTKIIKLPIDRLWVSIYHDDDESFDIWTKDIGISPDRVVKLGKSDNFWEHGKGPCGPCSEIYFDRGEKYGCNSPNCTVGCECDRYVEFWNLVFTQFSNDGTDNYTPLEFPNIDTGMGLERLACIMQGVDNLFLIDTVKNIMDKVTELTCVQYGQSEKTDISLRIITDHVRSIVFMVSDGILPSNEGRGYVLRRLLRRASRHGHLLGVKEPFIFKVCDVVIKENETVYPELLEKRNFIIKLVKSEEENFHRTLNAGMQLLDKIVSDSSSSVLSGDIAFKLNDTYGFPIDLTKEILLEHNMTVDTKSFEELMHKQKQLARTSRKKISNEGWFNDNNNNVDIEPTKFCGYEHLECKANIVAIVSENKKVKDANSGDTVGIILDKTCLYAESGGQVGDTGIISNSKCNIVVDNTTKDGNGVFLHLAHVDCGSVSVGDEVDVSVDMDKRADIMRNHTAAHLLQAALRKALGTHVEQAGQMVNDKQLRFDFTHFSPLTKEELAHTENLVNEEIFKAIGVNTTEMPIEQAKKLGAMALFGEKYSDIVRVVSLDDGFSRELCGGTHVHNTSEIGLFKIISENSVSAGVRRIVAYTGKGVLNLLNSSLNILEKTAETFKLRNKLDIYSHCKQLLTDNKNQKKVIDELKQKSVLGDIQKILSDYVEVSGVKLITKVLPTSDSKTLKSIADTVKDKYDDVVLVIAGGDSEKSNFLCVAGEKAVVAGIHCGKLIKEIAKITGANGGGRPNFAMSGIKDTSKIDLALKSAKGILQSYLQGGTQNE